MLSPIVAHIARLAVSGLCLAGLTACNAVSPLGYYGSGYDPRDMPGTPRTPIQIYRRLLEDGYESLGPPIQAGAVYFADVVTAQGGRHKCIVLHAFSGVILQRFSVGPYGLRAEIHHTPGPGFPGYPPVRDGRYAQLCPLVIPLVEKDPLIVPGLGPEPIRARY